MQHYSQSKDINKLVRDLVRDGWVPVRRKRHYQIISPAGIVQTIPGSSGDWRSLMNLKKDIRREIGR
jgi:hypothetical protein